MKQLPTTLRENVRLLGSLLGEILTKHEGAELFGKVEAIRAMTKSLNSEDSSDHQPLVDMLRALEDKDILPIARAYNQFLNLANIADQEYFCSAEAQGEDSLEQLLGQLKEHSSAEELHRLLQELRIELVLTAHPTEVTRRTLIRKYDGIAGTLSDRSRNDLLQFQKDKLTSRLHRLIEEVWTTNEIRDTRPTAVDEAKWGFAVIENSLWQALPDFLKHLNRLCQRQLDLSLPLEIQPLHIASWMGGDRDGNPNVTHEVTEEVVLLGRWKAAELFLMEIQSLERDLSMHGAPASFIAKLDAPASAMPYKDVLRRLRIRLEQTLEWTETCINLERLPEPPGLIRHREDLLEPLLAIHEALTEQGCEHIANGPLTDTIRRIYAFGINLAPLDIRQDADRHVQVLDELTQYLELGSYRQWNEAERQAFLLEQLSGKRPLLPPHWQPSDDSQEVLDTCRVIAAQPQETLSHYVISMAQQASDVLAVALLLKECGVSWAMPIVPLFETLDDLDRAPAVMNALWQNDWYQSYLEPDNAAARQTVMIGYSDSAKDAGKLAATWAQYKAQESLVELARKYSVSLTLFHGRGGTVGRGGGPVEKAMASQPPGSINGNIRVTEQGEMIRYKYGLPKVAFRSFSNYMVSLLKASVTPDPAPSEAWREMMEKLSSVSLEAYRGIVRGHPDFVRFFRSLTPEQELGKLALGSRPAKRKASGGIESLRAIPWVFAWMQVRLNLPSWLGTSQALAYAREEKPEILKDMLENWPFFSSFIDLLEMVVGKADAAICAHYERQLVDEDLYPLGEKLRADLAQLENLLLQIKGVEEVLDDDPVLQMSIQVRKTYINPLNYLQAELLRRERQGDTIGQELDQALKVTMAGISAGMRNTG